MMMYYCILFFFLLTLTTFLLSRRDYRPLIPICDAFIVSLTKKNHAFTSSTYTRTPTTTRTSSISSRTNNKNNNVVAASSTSTKRSNTSTNSILDGTTPGLSTNTISNGIDYAFLIHNHRHGEHGIKSHDQENNHNNNNSTASLLHVVWTQDEINYITELVTQRSNARKNGDYVLADSIRNKIDALSFSSLRISDNDNDNDEYKIEIKDIPRKEGGGSTWTLQNQHKESIEWMEPTGDDGDDDGNNNNITPAKSSVLQIAHTALGFASWSSENNIPIDNMVLNDLLKQAKQRIYQTKCYELRGRKAADAAFWFAMAGITDVGDDKTPANNNQNDDYDDSDDDNNKHKQKLKFSLFDALTFICIQELQRFGKRSSCRSTDILHMVERIAAAGVQTEFTITLQKVAADCLAVKKDASIHEDMIRILQCGQFELHSERSLLWIWRFSTRQRKQQAFLKSASIHWESSSSITNTKSSSLSSSSTITGSPLIPTNSDSISPIMMKWDEIFGDVNRDLVVDIGCGMGISILGLSSFCLKNKNSSNLSSSSPLTRDLEKEIFIDDIDLSACNYLGADLSQLAINYASSISSRWDLNGRVHFEVISAEEMLEHVVNTYPGNVKLVMIQFPTPFSFQEDDDDNSSKKNGQNNEILNSVVLNSGNQQLPKSAYHGFMVTKHLLDLVNRASNDSDGKLLIQSNCEDVAVLMKNIAIEQSGFQTLDVPKCVVKFDDKIAVPKRTKKWIGLGGERAEGSCWSSIPLLPKKSATETEIACSLNGIPIHRCILEVCKSKK